MKPIGPIVARIVVRTILARLHRTVWTIDGTARKSKGPERLLRALVIFAWRGGRSSYQKKE